MLVTDTLPSKRPAGSSGTGLRWLAIAIVAILAGLATLPFLASRAADATMDELQTVADKQRAYDRLLACAAGKQPKQACIDGWMRDAAALIPDADQSLARTLLDYYVDGSLRGAAGRKAELCG